MPRSAQTTSATEAGPPPRPSGKPAGDERAPAASVLPGQVVIVTGLSGAGKSQASKLFEDLGYYCVDNLPPELVERFLALREADPERYQRVALVLDIRAGDPADAIERARRTLAPLRVAMEVLYLEASDATLVGRFSETRHRHPLQTDAERGAGRDRRGAAPPRGHP
jgi:UPF0042 nucleotide-binding protein